MVWTGDLVAGRFDTSEEYASNAITQAEDYMKQLEDILHSLELPDTTELAGINFPDISPIDYSSRPIFSEALDIYSILTAEMPINPNLENVKDIDIDIPQENINFIENTLSAPSILVDNPPENNIDIGSIDIPPVPEFEIPNVPVLSNVVIPSVPIINLPQFDALPPDIDDIPTPQEFKYIPAAYNSDIRVPLFNKILWDIQNGGTGLDVQVEQDIYDRGRERQRIENERLYQEVENQFSATGFTLPSGSFASRMLEVSNEISRKNDQTNREITINQAELAQKNTQFTTDQARQIETLLIEFYNQQENRTLEAAKAMVMGAVEIFNALINKEKLGLEKYQTEATVFEQKVKAELVAVEIYKAQIEGMKGEVELQQAQVNIYKTKIEALDTILKLYATEMESVKIKTEIQKTKIEIFKAQTEAYSIQVGAEEVKAKIYNTQIEGEKTRAIIYGEKVKAYQTKIEAKKAEMEILQINADNVFKKNQLLIEEYKAKVDGYKANLAGDLHNAEIQTQGFKAEALAFETQTNAQGLEYSTRIHEYQVEIELIKAKILKQVSELETVREGYIALKKLEVSGTEGLMNANAQLAASALNAVNVSASQSIGSSESSTTSDGISYIHTYKEK